MITYLNVLQSSNTLAPHEKSKRLEALALPKGLNKTDRAHCALVLNEMKTAPQKGAQVSAAIVHHTDATPSEEVYFQKAVCDAMRRPRVDAVISAQKTKDAQKIKNLLATCITTITHYPWYTPEQKMQHLKSLVQFECVTKHAGIGRVIPGKKTNREKMVRAAMRAVQREIDEPLVSVEDIQSKIDTIVSSQATDKEKVDCLCSLGMKVSSATESSSSSQAQIFGSRKSEGGTELTSEQKTTLSESIKEKIKDIESGAPSLYTQV